jgi:protein-S-isoprenylcysteine O-methyltransferase Ste14
VAGKSHPILPPGYFLIALGVALALDRFVPGSEWVPSPLHQAGWGLVAFGIWMAVHPSRHFDKAETTIKPHEESEALVTEGFYRVSRNPMYLGMGLALLGVAIVLRSLPALLVPGIFVLLVDLVFIRTEEELLTERFGDAYRRYRDGVRRWI